MQKKEIKQQPQMPTKWMYHSYLAEYAMREITLVVR
jgi:hypothetical protein